MRDITSGLFPSSKRQPEQMRYAKLFPGAGWRNNCESYGFGNPTTLRCSFLHPSQAHLLLIAFYNIGNGNLGEAIRSSSSK